MFQRLASDFTPTLIQWGIAHNAVRAMLLTSSRTVPGAKVDLLSDYDLILVVQDIHPFLDDRSWLGDFGEVLVVFWDPVSLDPFYGLEHCANVTQYIDGLKIDFTLWPVELFQRIVAAPELPAEMDAGYRLLLDKDQLAASLRSPTYAAYLPKPPTQTAYQTLINDFLSDAPYVAKCLWRMELFPVKWCLDYDMKHIYLRQLLVWYIELDHNWSVRADLMGKGLKGYLPSDIWSELEQTYATAQITANWDALSRTLALFRRIAIEVGERLGYAYPELLHQRVCAYIEQIRQLPAG